MHAELLLLRALHVLCGVVWVGGAVFLQFALTPALLSLGPPAGQVVAALQARRLFRWLPWIALLTILTGARLIWIVSAGLNPAFMQSRAGASFLGSGVLALVAFVTVMTVSRPAAIRAGGLAARVASVEEAARGPLLAELAALRQRSTWVGGVATLLLVLATLGMGVARYL